MGLRNISAAAFLLFVLTVMWFHSHLLQSLCDFRRFLAQKIRKSFRKKFAQRKLKCNLDFTPMGV